MRRITYVTGVSCAGKTTVGEALTDAQRDEHGLDWLDLDVHAVCRPNTAWRDWLDWRAAELLHTATQDEGHLLATGIVWPTHVIQSPAWRPAVKADVQVRFVMLDPPWKVIKARLNERLAGKPKGERRELLDYNRQLRKTLADQVEAMRHGQRVRDVAEPAAMVELIVTGGIELIGG